MPALPSPQATVDRAGSGMVAHVCHACGRTTQDTRSDSFVYRGGASFCLTCWQTLPGAAIEKVTQAVKLRGVPL